MEQTMVYPSPYLSGQSGPEIEQWVGSAGFTVTYRDPNPKTLSLIREYQARIRIESPGWPTRLEFDPVTRRARVHVFPQGQLMPSLFHQPLSYACGR